MSDKSSNACSAICAGLFVAIFGILAIAFSLQDADASCMGVRGGITLYDWLFMQGAVQLSTVVMYGVLSFSMCCCSNLPDFVGGGAFLLGLALAFYHVIMLIWGIVILSASPNNACVAEGKASAVYSIVYIVLSESWGGVLGMMISAVVTADGY